jgi:hypothetical protein
VAILLALVSYRSTDIRDVQKYLWKNLHPCADKGYLFNRLHRSFIYFDQAAPKGHQSSIFELFKRGNIQKDLPSF